MSDNGGEAPTAGDSSRVEYIKFKMVGQENEIHFRVKSCIAMGELKRIYANHTGVAVSSLRFLFDGHRVNDDDTPRTLEMENDDVIEVYQEYLGGH